MLAKKFTKRFKFKNWPNPNIPQIDAGDYVIWHGEELQYPGMSGREIIQLAAPAVKWLIKYTEPRLRTTFSPRVMGHRINKVL